MASTEFENEPFFSDRFISAGMNSQLSDFHTLIPVGALFFHHINYSFTCTLKFIYSYILAYSVFGKKLSGLYSKEDNSTN